MDKNDPTTKLAKAKASLERWQRRQTRAANAVSRLLKVIKRLEKAAAEAPKPKLALPKPVETDHLNEAQFEKFAKALPKSPAEPLDIPAIFDRRSEATKRADRERLAKLNDAETAAAIKAEQAEHKKKKAAGQAAKRKAKLSGETRRMPLQGKAALEAIRKSE